jgi:hypothetical protein
VTVIAPRHVARINIERACVVHRLVVILLVIAGISTPLVTSAQQTKETASGAAKNVPKTYVPGLEQFMNVILMEHNKLWFAAKARNWRLAEYQLGEIKEVMGDVQDLVPTFKNLPLADMLDAVITKEISALEKSIEAKDYKTFVSGYDKLTQACNACHQGTENEFIVIQRPARPAFTNQVYDKRR